MISKLEDSMLNSLLSNNSGLKRKHQWGWEESLFLPTLEETFEKCFALTTSLN